MLSGLLRCCSSLWRNYEGTAVGAIVHKNARAGLSLKEWIQTPECVAAGLVWDDSGGSGYETVKCEIAGQAAEDSPSQSDVSTFLSNKNSRTMDSQDQRNTKMSDAETFLPLTPSSNLRSISSPISSPTKAPSPARIPSAPVFRQLRLVCR